MASDWELERDIAAREAAEARETPLDRTARALMPAQVHMASACPREGCAAARGAPCRHETRVLDGRLDNDWAHIERRRLAVEELGLDLSPLRH